MGNVLIFDTETTGPDPLTARLVQLGAILMDENGKERAVIDLMVRPDGFAVPEEAAKIHGISTETALSTGVPLAVAAALLNNLAKQATLVVGHNVSYDITVMNSEIVRLGKQREAALSRLPVFCTKEESSPIMKMPPTERMVQAGFGHRFKPPTLSEAYLFFMKKELQDAHSALVDVRACLEIYKILKKEKK